jgi:hypothetical protein
MDSAMNSASAFFSHRRSEEKASTGVNSWSFNTLYKCWMKFARILGRIQTALILSLIYFIGVGTIAIISFLFRKDFLDKRLGDEPSFWRSRVSTLQTLENCKRQF